MSGVFNSRGGIFESASEEAITGGQIHADVSLHCKSSLICNHEAKESPSKLRGIDRDSRKKLGQLVFSRRFSYLERNRFMSTLKVFLSLGFFGSALFLAQNSATAQGKGGNCQRSQGQMPPSTSTGIVGSPVTTGLTTTTATPVDPATGQQIVTMSSALQTLIESGTMTPAQQQRAATVLSVAARVRQTGVMTQSQKQILASAYATLQQMAAAANAQSEAITASTSTTSTQQANQTKTSSTRAQAKISAARKKSS